MADDPRPWLRHYGAVPASLEYPDTTLPAALAAMAGRIPASVALEYLGSRITYRELHQAVERCAGALVTLGVGPGDRLLISLPTCPQGIIAFYAANHLAAVPAMIHPESAPAEVAHYLRASGARVAVTLATRRRTLETAREGTPLERLLLTREDETAAVPESPGRTPEPGVWWWHELIPRARPAAAAHLDPEGLAAILFSGGTTGLPKAIMLSSRNFIAEAMEAAAWVGMGPDDIMLAALPIFHGVGLGLCVLTVLLTGARSVLVPRFVPSLVAAEIQARRPTLMVGIPTLYDALAREPALARVDFSCLRAAFVGADVLPPPIKERFERLVASHGGRVKLLEGYGLTETVTGIMAMPLTERREGSIGLPFPDTLASICRPGTTHELGPGEDGEICISGPAVMLGYLDDPRGTAEVLRRHADGRVWLHTGDLGRRDEEGFFYFTGRLKRMIKSSGFTVNPVQVEEALLSHPAVAEAFVVGVPDPSQIERVKAFVVPRGPEAAGPGLERELIAHCRQRLIKWSCPREVEFREELPKTRLGKVDLAALRRSAAVAAPGGAQM
jgi:long-chain acyl-CoA synthetase